ncbi:MAG: ethanolamine ammonia-lyase reactivating factor EutA [Chloroflexi bacterium]|nr:ethanolamine ammonia-lyase reactivating factor EutA [Chloroflexota bacterium]
MHDEDEMHEHDVMELLEGDDVEEIEGIEKFTLRSVGIDIGSSTTHTIFSRLVLRREGAGLSSKFVVASRDILYRSPIMLTPYLGGTLIDVEKVTTFINESYASAGFTPSDIDTGAVVITGEALKKENSQPIIEHFSEESGRFICATAGPMHEALLAAHGSGAVGMSKHHSNAVLDIDMGGGTTKVSLIQHGEVVQMIAVEIGARLIAYDDDMTITRVEQPAHTIMKALGDSVEVGGKLTTKQAEAFSEKMTDILFDVVSGGKLDPLSASLMLTDPLHYDSLDAIDHIVFSGGVSEYIYERTTESYGDVGPIFGAMVRKRAEATLKKGVLVASVEGIRATVIGAGEYTLQASGSTSYISTADVLPVHGIQVARALIDKEQSDEEVHQAILAALGKYDVVQLNGNMALALSVAGQPDYWYIRRVAEAIASVTADGPSGAPAFIVLDVDVAKSLGGILVEELSVDRSVIAIDGIEVGDLDYIDIGKPMGVSEVIPVTVKSLIFALRSASG